MNEFQQLREARKKLADASRALKETGGKLNNPSLMSALSQIAKKTRLVNLQFAFLKGQSIYAVETPPYDKDQKIIWVNNVRKMMATLSRESEEDRMVLEIWRREVQEIKDQAIREIVKERIK